MNAIVLITLCYLSFGIAYRFYGWFLSRRVFKLNSSKTTPAVTLKDGEDFVPTHRNVLFGHHFTSIAGTGPIVGPAIGVIWGWGPALLWVVFGSIFIGAFHDLASLILSVRNKGKSMSDIAANYINRRVQKLFYLIVFLALLIVIAIFGMVIAIIFDLFPQAVIPVWFQIPIAIGLGAWVYKRQKSLVWSTAVAVAFMYILMAVGLVFPIRIPEVLGIPATGLWTIILLAYAFVASVLPVTTLLQPRDYMNAWQLYLAMGLLVLGVLVTGTTGALPMTAPAFNLAPTGAPPIWPFLFITIACGAVSGFHCCVSSGTSSKQVKCERDVLFVGYGSMLVEAALAVLVIVAVTAGLSLAYQTSDGELLTGIQAWRHHYASWGAAQGLGTNIKAVVVGCSNFMKSLHIPTSFGVVLMGVFIASFAGTTLDSTTRIQRYIIAELFSGTRIKWAQHKYIATFFAVFSAMLLAFSSGADGRGALLLWPMFGAVNQLLAALALMVVTIYLVKNRKQYFWLSGIPCAFMLAMTLWATWINQVAFLHKGQWILVLINGFILTLSFWMVIETVLVFYKALGFKRGVL